ncbi:MAG: DUF3047 domain-containing protein [Candidatus Brocadiae bacterium]|nr:DUF3047 domain-containing protein [Candidatus Brocadiia bacterium]
MTTALAVLLAGVAALAALDAAEEKGVPARINVDDYAARIYVNFKYDPDRVGWWTRLKYSRARKRLGEYPPLHTLNYIWANTLERGALSAHEGMRTLLWWNWMTGASAARQ